MLQLRTGLRLESLRLSIKKSIEVAARLGVNAVEINARSELRPQDLSRTAIRHLKKLLSDRDLNVCSLQFPTRRTFFDEAELDRRLDATRQAMSIAFDLGARVVVGSPTRIPNPEDESAAYTLFTAALTDLATHGQKVGCVLALSLFDSGELIEKLMSDLPPGVGIDFDPADLIINSHSPVDTIRRIGDRVVQFRARDAVRDFSQGRGIQVQLGRGSSDLVQLLGLLEENQFNGHFVIEAAGDADFEVSCSNAIDYLKSLF